MSQSTSEVVLRTPAEWMSIKMPGRFIANADGWRGQNGRSFDDPISEEEFWQRSMSSTLGLRNPKLHVTGGRAAVAWERDAAQALLLQAKAQDAFQEWQDGNATREEFVDAREVWRDAYASYTERWGDNPEALELIDRRVVEAPEGWND